MTRESGAVDASAEAVATYGHHECDYEKYGEQFALHMERMTVEQLGGKSEIAWELAYRDHQIAALLADRERLAKHNLELVFRAYAWMTAHDKLKAGEKYEFPKPADVPDAIRKIDQIQKELDAARANERRWMALLKRVIGEHFAPDDCYSTGPLHGDARDHSCPSCEAIAAIVGEPFGCDLYRHQQRAKL